MNSGSRFLLVLCKSTGDIVLHTWTVQGSQVTYAIQFLQTPTPIHLDFELFQGQEGDSSSSPPPVARTDIDLVDHARRQF